MVERQDFYTFKFYNKILDSLDKYLGENNPQLF